MELRHFPDVSSAAGANRTGGPNPQDSPGLASDRMALLQSRDTLAGSATLNWRADRDISDWDGVAVSGSPPRVTRLILSDHELSGSIPPQLGTLTKLELLHLNDNQLSGSIPPELGALTSLETHLHRNELTGPPP